jgi:hypothetical protein
VKFPGVRNTRVRSQDVMHVAYLARNHGFLPPPGTSQPANFSSNSTRPVHARMQTLLAPFYLLILWLGDSLRHTNHRPYLPHRDYFSTDMKEGIPDEIYEVDVEIWPTTVTFSASGKLVLEIRGADAHGTGRFKHEPPADRSTEKLEGVNRIVFGNGHENYLVLPFIREARNSHRKVEDDILG